MWVKRADPWCQYHFFAFGKIQQLFNINKWGKKKSKSQWTWTQKNISDIFDWPHEHTHQPTPIMSKTLKTVLINWPTLINRSTSKGHPTVFDLYRNKKANRENLSYHLILQEFFPLFSFSYEVRIIFIEGLCYKENILTSCLCVALFISSARFLYWEIWVEFSIVKHKKSPTG